MTKNNILTSTAAVLLVATVNPDFAAACSCAATAHIAESLPADGATDVPTNVVPWVSTAADSVTLLDPNGDPIAAAIRSGDRFFYCDYGDYQIVPEAPLAPNTEYRIVTSATSFFEDGGLLTEEVSFTTGAGPADLETPPALELDAVLFEGSALQSSCNEGRIMGCLELEGERPLMELRAKLDGDEIFRRVSKAAGDVSQIYIDAAEGEFCVEVRAVDLIGQRSAPAEFCGATGALPVVEDESLGTPLDELAPFCEAARTLSASPDAGTLEPTEGGGSRRPEVDASTKGDDASTADPPESDEEDEGASDQDVVPNARSEKRRSKGCSVGESGRSSSTGFGFLVAMGTAFGGVMRRRRLRKP